MKDEVLKDLEKDRSAGYLSEDDYKGFCKELEDKWEQRESIVAEYKAGKIKDPEYDSWMMNIGEDMRRIHSRERELVNKNIEKDKRRRGLQRMAPFILSVVLVAMCIGIAAVSNYLYEHRDIANLSEPVQVNMQDILDAEKYPEKVERGKTFQLSYGSGHYTMEAEYLAKYDIDGLLVVKKEYNGNNAYDHAFPIDLSISWGSMAANNHLTEYKHGYRKLSVGFPRELMQATGKSRSEMMSEVSNTHITAETNELLNEIRRAKVGDRVHLRGYLISAKVIDSSMEEFSISSSLSRSDFMSGVFDTTNTGCEVMLVTFFEKK